MRRALSARSTLGGLLRGGRIPLAAAALTALAAIVSACSDSDTPHPGPAVEDTGATSDGAADATHADADATLGDTGAEAGDASDGAVASDATDATDVQSAEAETSVDGGADVADAPDAPDAVVYGGMCSDAAAEAGAPSGSCNAVVQSFPDDGHAHVEVGSSVTYCTMPPNSGPHYGLWARYRTYDTPVPWPYLVHDMEHGAVLVLYKCAGSCPAVAAQLQAVIDARPVDALCDPDAGVSRRVILAPAPDLDVPIAAAAWQWTYKASCVDAASLGAFIDAHYAMASENFCGDGQYP
jgi:hypothetical protein